MIERILRVTIDLGDDWKHLLGDQKLIDVDCMTKYIQVAGHKAIIWVVNAAIPDHDFAEYIRATLASPCINEGLKDDDVGFQSVIFGHEWRDMILHPENWGLRWEEKLYYPEIDPSERRALTIEAKIREKIYERTPREFFYDIVARKEVQTRPPGWYAESTIWGFDLN